MKTWVQWTLVAVPAAILGMLLTANGPIGALIWPMPDDATTPTNGQLPFLIGIDVLQAAAFGFGVAFLVYGYPLIRNLGYGGPVYAVLVYVSVAWGLVSWVPHIALHQSVGNITGASELWALIGVDYAFHVTALGAAFVFAHFFLRVVQGRGSPAGAERLVKAERATMPAPVATGVRAKAKPVGGRGRGK